MKVKTERLALASVFTTLIFIATRFFSIPVASGIVHPADGLILMSGAALGPRGAFAAAGVGSAMANILGAGGAQFAPASFILKGLIGFGAAIAVKKCKNNFQLLFAFSALEFIFLVCGYFLYFMLIFDLSAAISQLPFFFMIGAVGLAIGMAGIPAIKKLNLRGDLQ